MKKILLIVAVAAVTMAACCKKTTAEAYDFAGKKLQLIELNGKEYAPATTVRPVEINFDKENRMNGTTGCNLFNGAYAVKADTLSFPQPIAMTRMMCDEASNQIEISITKLLNGASTYTVTNDIISLFNGETLVAKFRVASGEGKSCCQGGHGDKDHKCGQGGHGDKDHKCCKGDSARLDKNEVHKCMHKGDSAKQCPNHKPQISPAAPIAPADNEK